MSRPSIISMAVGGLVKLIWTFLPLFVLFLFLKIPAHYISDNEYMVVFVQLGGTALLVIIQLLILYKKILPRFTSKVTDTLTASNDPMDEDETITEAKRLYEQNRPNDADELYRQYIKENPRSVRAWMLRVDFLTHELARYSDAAKALKEALDQGHWSKEDSAFFLYRLGKLYNDHLNEPNQAKTYWEQAVMQYPRTAYGREAIKKLR